MRRRLSRRTKKPSMSQAQGGVLICLVRRGCFYDFRRIGRCKY